MLNVLNTRRFKLWNTGFTLERQLDGTKAGLCSRLGVNSNTHSYVNERSRPDNFPGTALLRLCMKIPLVKSAVRCYWQAPSVAALSVGRLEIGMTSTAVQRPAEETLLSQKLTNTSVTPSCETLGSCSQQIGQQHFYRVGEVLRNAAHTHKYSLGKCIMYCTASWQ